MNESMNTLLLILLLLKPNTNKSIGIKKDAFCELHKPPAMQLGEGDTQVGSL